MAQSEVLIEPAVEIQREASIPEVEIEPEVVRQSEEPIKAQDLREPQEKSYRRAWKRDLANLSNNKNWDVNGFLTQQWIENAVKDAIEFIKEGDISVREILDDLDDRLNELYEVINPSTGKEMVASTLNRQLNVIDNFLVINPFKRILESRITPKLMSQAKEQKQLKKEQKEQAKQQRLAEQKLEEQRLAKLERTIQRQEEEKKQQEQHREIKRAIKQKVATKYYKTKTKKTSEMQQEEQPSLMDKLWSLLGYSSKQQKKELEQQKQRNRE